MGTGFVWTVYLIARGTDRKYLVLVGALAGLLLLTKGLAAGIFVLIVLPVVIWRWRRFLSPRYTPLCIGLTAAIGGWWPLLMYSVFGDQFVRTFLVSQVLDRATGPAAAGAIFPFMKYPYFRHLASFADPWIWIAIPASAYLIYLRDDRHDTVFLLYWGCSVVIFFAVTGNHGHYIYPAYVPLAIIVGISISDVLNGARTAAIAVGSGIGITFIFSPRVGVLDLRWLLWGIEPTPKWTVTAGLVLLLGSFVVSQNSVPTVDLRFVFSNDSTPIAIVIVSVLVATALAAPALIPTPYGETQRNAGYAVAMTTPPDATIYYSTNASAKLLSFAFYSDRRFQPTSIENIRTNETIRYALVTEGEAASIDRPIGRQYEISGQWPGRGNYTVLILPPP